MSKRLKTSEEEEKKVADPDDVFIGLDDVIRHDLVRFLPVEDRVRFLCGVNKRLRDAFGYSHVIGSKDAPVTPWFALGEDDYRPFVDLLFLRFLASRTITGYRMHITLRPRILDPEYFDEMNAVYLAKDHVDKFMRIESLDIYYLDDLMYMERMPQYLTKDVSAVYVGGRDLRQEYSAELPSEARKDRYAPIRSIRFQSLGTWYFDEVAFLKLFRAFDSVLHPDASITIEKYAVMHLSLTSTLVGRVQEVESLEITDLQKEGDIHLPPGIMLESRERVQYFQTVLAPIVLLMKKARAIECNLQSSPRRRALDSLLQLFATSAGPKRHTTFSVSIEATDPPLSPLAASQCTAVTLVSRLASEYKAETLATLRGLVHFTNMTRLVAFCSAPKAVAMSLEYQVSVPEAAKTIIGGRIQLRLNMGYITLEVDWPAPPDAPALRTLARELYRLSLWVDLHRPPVYGYMLGLKAAEMAAAEFE